MPARFLAKVCVAPGMQRPHDDLVALTFFAAYVLGLILGLLIWAGVIGLAMGLSFVVAAALIAVALGALGKLSGF